MKIVCQNFLVNGKKVDEPTVHQHEKPIVTQPADSLQTIRKTIEKIQVVERIPAIDKTKIVEGPTEQYLHIKDGDLHKLINRKSSYLKDMIDFEDNK